MRVSVSEAKGRLTELVRRAEAGGEVVVTRRGRDVARLVPIESARNRRARRALLDDVRATAAAKAVAGPSAAHSQDFLYSGRFPEPHPA